MTGLPWYAHSIAAYEKNTDHLSMLQHGAYRLLLDRYYKMAAPIPANLEQVHRICRAVADDERAAVVSVLDEFFVLGEDGWHNERADQELARMLEISGKRRDSAKKSHASRASAEATAHANGSAKAVANAGANANTLNIEHRTDISSLRSGDGNAQKPDLLGQVKEPTKASKAGEPPGFSEFYDAFPLKKGRPGAAKAYAAALKRTTAWVLLAAAKSYAIARRGEDPKFTKWPQGWLSDDRWRDEPAGSGATSLNAAVTDGVNPAFVQQPWESRHHFLVRRFKLTNLWLSQDGAPPDSVDCRLPESILIEFGYRQKPGEAA